MRIVSLLPSLTELVAALGRGDELVGVTHECDYPPGVELLPHLTRSKLTETATSAEIDTLVSEERGGLYELDETALAECRPDLILTQEQCDVCAVNERTVRRAAMSLPGSPPVESVNPTDLAGLFAMFRRLGDLLDAREKAEELIARFDAITAEVACLESSPPVRMVLLEWLDPPFTSGHWNPELTERGGGIEVLGKAGEKSRRVTWDEIHAADPDVILLAPCGFTIERSLEEWPTLQARPEWQRLRAVRDGRVSLTDGSAFFARPGPRLADAIRLVASAIAGEETAHLRGVGTAHHSTGQHP